MSNNLKASSQSSSIKLGGAVLSPHPTLWFFLVSLVASQLVRPFEKVFKLKIVLLSILFFLNLFISPTYATPVPWPTPSGDSSKVTLQPVPKEAQHQVPHVDEKPINANLIRVGISDNRMREQEYRTAQIAANGAFTVTDKSNGKQVYKAAPWQSIRITVSNKGFYLRNMRGALIRGPLKGPLLATPVKGFHMMRVTNITRKRKTPSYRGSLEITRGYSGRNKLSIVNVLPLQDYLKAVVPNELPIRFGYEAVKAQSVAARNYAIRPREKFWPQFDICDSQYCQAYYGAQTETPQTTNALRETEGLVVLHQGDPILALYSSSHGGVAESYSNAFSEPRTNQYPGKYLPYLRGGPDSPKVTQDLTQEAAARAFWTNKKAPSFDQISPHYRWAKHWPRSVIQSVLNRSLADVSKDTMTKSFVSPLFKPGQTIGELKRIHVLKRGVSGKIMTMMIEGTNGKWTVNKEFVIRKVLKHRNRMLPSANIVFSHLTDNSGRIVTLKAEGGGFGHGVGMSQYGASYMGKHGYQFPAILKHYYKDTTIGSIPVTVGGSTTAKPIKTRFYVKKANAKLHLESNQSGEPVYVMFNKKPYLVRNFQQGKATVPVGAVLKVTQPNEMIVYPDTKHPNRKLKAWVELY